MLDELVRLELVGRGHRSERAMTVARRAAEARMLSDPSFGRIVHQAVGIIVADTVTKLRGNKR